MADHSVVTLCGGEATQSPGTDIFESVELYFGDDLEMLGHLVVILSGQALHGHCWFPRTGLFESVDYETTLNGRPFIATLGE